MQILLWDMDVDVGIEMFPFEIFRWKFLGLGSRLKD
jgi:hypothetical protein